MKSFVHYEHIILLVTIGHKNTAHCSKVIGKGGQNVPAIKSKIIEISNKLNILGSFLSRCDQCTLWMNAGIIEFASLEQVLLVKIKNVSAK